MSPTRKSHDGGETAVKQKDPDPLGTELEELRDTLRAIRNGEVDAIVVDTRTGPRVYTLTGADKPYRVLFEQMTEGALTVSPEGTILYSNQAFAEMVKTPLESVLGSRLEDLISERDKLAFRAMIGRSWSHSPRGVISMVVSDGSERPVLLSMRALPFESSPAICMVLTDLTERVKAEEALTKLNNELELKVKERTERLAKSNAELQTFAYAASHDLREPLRTISGFLELLKMDYFDKLDDQGKNHIRRTLAASSRLSEMIDDLLVFTRLGSRMQPFKSIDLTTVFNAVVDDLGAMISKTGATVTAGYLPTVAVDDVQIAIVFQNLIDNAIKYHSEATPVVFVDSKRQGDDWVISVKDNGIGIDRKHFDKLFNMFVRLRGRDEYEGTGIGLAICKKVVESHGGRIWVESDPGKGSTFVFSLPAVRDGSVNGGAAAFL